MVIESENWLLERVRACGFISDGLAAVTGDSRMTLGPSFASPHRSDGEWSLLGAVEASQRGKVPLNSLWELALRPSLEPAQAQRVGGKRFRHLL